MKPKPGQMFPPGGPASGRGSSAGCFEVVEEFQEERRSFTREQLTDMAKAFMIKEFGPPQGADDKDQWYTNYGMLCHFALSVYDRDLGI